MRGLGYVQFRDGVVWAELGMMAVGMAEKAALEWAVGLAVRLLASEALGEGLGQGARVFDRIPGEVVSWRRDVSSQRLGAEVQMVLELWLSSGVGHFFLRSRLYLQKWDVNAQQLWVSRSQSPLKTTRHNVSTWQFPVPLWI